MRLGFELATKDILMILDADLTTPPEELPKFYNAIAENKAEFVNGSRLVYPMEKQAMRFFNILANKFFAAAFSFVLGQRFKDTLCGTKVLSRAHYKRLAATREFFGDFDPFGDFDLLFGAARMGLKIVEIPVHYHERKYGTTNIQRWRHGLILLRMLAFRCAALEVSRARNSSCAIIDCCDSYSCPDPVSSVRGEVKGITRCKNALRREIQHGRFLAEHGAGEIWNWESPAGNRAGRAE